MLWDRKDSAGWLSIRIHHWSRTTLFPLDAGRTSPNAVECQVSSNQFEICCFRMPGIPSEVYRSLRNGIQRHSNRSVDFGISNQGDVYTSQHFVMQSYRFHSILQEIFLRSPVERASTHGITRSSSCRSICIRWLTVHILQHSCPRIAMFSYQTLRSVTFLPDHSKILVGEANERYNVRFITQKHQYWSFFWMSSDHRGMHLHPIWL